MNCTSNEVANEIIFLVIKIVFSLVYFPVPDITGAYNYNCVLRHGVKTFHLYILDQG